MSETSGKLLDTKALRSIHLWAWVLFVCVPGTVLLLITVFRIPFVPSNEWRAATSLANSVGSLFAVLGFFILNARMELEPLDQSEPRSGQAKGLEFKEPNGITIGFFFICCWLVPLWIALLTPSIIAVRNWEPVSLTFRVCSVDVERKHSPGIGLCRQSWFYGVIRTEDQIVDEIVRSGDVVVAHGRGSWAGIFYSEVEVLRNGETVIVLPR